MAGWEWIAFYKEVADKLLAYQNNRGALVQMVKDVFSANALTLPKLERDNQLVDIDPFTFFALFNKKQSLANRIMIMSGFAGHLQISVAVPKSFDGVPELNNQNAAFYGFIGDRGKHDIDDLWKFFERALKVSESKSAADLETFSKYYDLIVRRKWNGISKITIGLFWVAPETFLSLDYRNKQYIYDSGKLPGSLSASLPKKAQCLSAARYLELLEKIKEFSQPSRNFLKI